MTLSSAAIAHRAGRDPLKYLLIAVTSLCWGLNWPSVKILLSQVPPLSLRALGFAAGAVLLLAMARAMGQRLRVERQEVPALLVTGVCNLLIFNLCTAFAQLVMATSQAAIIAFTMPVWATLLAMPMLGERPGGRQLVGLACGMAGLAVLLGPEAVSAPPAQLRGPALMLLAAVAWALGTILMKRRVWRTGMLALAGWQYAACALPMIVLAALLETPPDLSALRPATWTALGWHIVCSICLAQALWYVTVRRLSVGEAAVSTLLVPVVGVAGAVVILGDAVTLRLAAALALVVAAVACVLIRQQDRSS